MLFKRLSVMLMVLLTCGVAFAAGKGDLDVRTSKAGAKVTLDRIIKDGRVLVSVEDAAQNPVLGLGIADFTLSQGGKKGKIVSVQPIAEVQDVPRNIVMVLDNSYSMYERNAIKALLSGVDSVLKIVRPIDKVSLVTFDNKVTTKVGNRTLRVKTFQSSNQEQLRAYVKDAYSQQGLTPTTVLYEAMVAGLDFIAKAPAGEPRMMVVFSDGEDLNSTIKADAVFKAAQPAGKFNAYAIDYLEGEKTSKFLSKFTTDNRGKTFKAKSEADLVPIFQSVASKLDYYYVINYDFAPTAQVAASPASLKISEIKTIDSSPMLAQVFFATGSAALADQYVRFNAPAETAGFDEQKFRDTMEKYRQVLNIVGKRLVDNPAATVTLVGCNDNTGAEKGKTALSAQRAETVKGYLQSVWGIAPERMKVESRNLPAMPSAPKTKEGQAENRRVEIHSSDMAILAPIRSVYFSGRTDTPDLIVRPNVTSAYGVDTWKISASNGSGTFAELTGNGAPAKEIKIPLANKDLRAIGAGGDITVKFELKDKKGQQVAAASDPVKVNFSQISQRISEKEGTLTVEKYALILFDFNKDTIAGVNQEIINRVGGRIKALPQAKVDIVGHTDSIGSAAYNVKLSQRRAAEANKQLTAAAGPDLGKRASFAGVGPKDPLYDNKTPEGRAFNRTVTITLEYSGTE